MYLLSIVRFRWLFSSWFWLGWLLAHRCHPQFCAMWPFQDQEENHSNLKKGAVAHLRVLIWIIRPTKNDLSFVSSKISWSHWTKNQPEFHLQNPFIFAIYITGVTSYHIRSFHHTPECRYTGHGHVPQEAESWDLLYNSACHGVQAILITCTIYLSLIIPLITNIVICLENVSNFLSLHHSNSLTFIYSTASFLDLFTVLRQLKFTNYYTELLAVA